MNRVNAESVVFFFLCFFSDVILGSLSLSIPFRLVFRTFAPIPSSHSLLWHLLSVLRFICTFLLLLLLLLPLLLLLFGEVSVSISLSHRVQQISHTLAHAHSYTHSFTFHSYFGAEINQQCDFQKEHSKSKCRNDTHAIALFCVPFPFSA